MPLLRKSKHKNWGGEVAGEKTTSINKISLIKTELLKKAENN